MIKTLKEKNKKIIDDLVLTNKQEELKKQLLIASMLEDEQCFFKLDMNTALSILTNLGFNNDESSEAEQMKAEKAVLEALKGHFRPEFLNRVDEIVVFRKLSDEDIKRIAILMLNQINERIVNLGINLTFSDEVVDHLAKAGFDPVYGARPLRRAMQRQIEDSLSLKLLEGEVVKGDSIKAVLEDGKVVYIKN